MGFVENKIHDFVADNVEPENRAQATALLEDALDKREDGDLTLDEARKVINELIGLIRVEDQPKFRKMFEQNQAVLEKYLVK